MSHFTVLVRVSARLIKESGGLDAALTAMLGPYQENNMGDCPEQYLKFNDCEDEYKEEYETKSTECARLEDGSLVSRYDDEAKGLPFESIPNKVRFSSLEEYASEYHGVERDEKTGRYGYWENPNKKWDWWQLGGRWTGWFPLKPGAQRVIGKPGLMTTPPPSDKGDAVLKSEIDFDAVGSKMFKNAEAFWDEWQRFISGEKFGAFDGPREMAMRIGLIEVRQGPPNPGEEDRALPWKNSCAPDDPRSGWHDIYKRITKTEFFTNYLECFNPIAPYAVLDEESWKEPGKMGWFGFSSDTPEAYIQSKRAFADWLGSAPDDSTIALVDCHI
jgi:hypothetical protein